jgi:hypothetical protein
MKKRSGCSLVLLYIGLCCEVSFDSGYRVDGMEKSATLVGITGVDIVFCVFDTYTQVCDSWLRIMSNELLWHIVS